MLERAHLAILRALNEHGTLAEAAEHLCLTQSALSHAVRKLEQQFKVAVWQKEGRLLRLTQAGQYLLEVSLRVLPQMEEAEDALRAYAQGRRGTLRVGMECHPCYEWLLTVVAPFLERWPEVDLDVIQRFRFNGLEALQNHQIDLLVTSDPITDSQYCNEPMFEYELKLITAAAHPLAQQRNRIEAPDLQNQVLITFPVARERLDVFTRFLIPAGIEPAAQRHVEATEIMLQLVAAQRGVCTLPAWLAERFMTQYPIAQLTLGKAGVHKTLYLVFRRGDSDVDYLLDFVRTGQGGTPSSPSAASAAMT